MSKVIALTVVCLAIFIARNARSQMPMPARLDSTGYALPADSLRKIDSIYRAHKADLDRWIRTQQAAARPHRDLVSLYIEYGGYFQILPRDLNQLFSERTLRPDPLSDRNEYSTVD